jgi:hypothetical protein
LANNLRREYARSKAGVQHTENLQTKTAKTTALNHCVDCYYLKQSRRLTKYQLEGGGSQILFVAYQIREKAQAFAHSHSCESLECRTLLFRIESNCNWLNCDVNIFEETFLDEKPASPLTGS